MNEGEEPNFKDFNRFEFQVFLNRRNVNMFDPVSGIVKVSGTEVVVNEDGSVEGPEPLKSRVERWIRDFMSKR
jgi:hypothetical protein